MGARERASRRWNATHERLASRAVAEQSRLERTLPGGAARRFLDDRMDQRAAGLAFYGLFSLIPMLLIAAAVYNLVGDPKSAVDAQHAVTDAGASSSVANALRALLDTALSSTPQTAGSVGLTGLVTLVYGASKVYTDAGRALDEIAHVRGRIGRPLRKRAADFGWTLVLIGLGVVATVLVFVTSGLVRGVLDAVGLDSISGVVWDLFRWPAAGVVALVMVAIVTWAGPTTAHRPFRLLTAGGVVAVGLWLLASAGYSIYLDVFASYNATYGAFAAIVILMLWVWIACLSFLYGAELDAALRERSSTSS